MTKQYDIEQAERMLADEEPGTVFANHLTEKLTQLYQEQADEIAGPDVGDGVTMAGWTDRHAATVIKRTPKTVTVQRDKATRSDSNGMSDSQSYTYERDPEGATYRFSLRKNGTWRKVGDSDKGMRMVAGRREYYDYSF